MLLLWLEKSQKMMIEDCMKNKQNLLLILFLVIGSLGNKYTV